MSASVENRETHQSNNLEYMILAKASLLRRAASGSRVFVIVSSRVTMIRLHRESSSDFSSHLQQKIMWIRMPTSVTYRSNPLQSISRATYMRSSAAVLKWNQDFSSLGIDESISVPLANSIFPRCRMEATTRKIASYRHTENVKKLVIKIIYQVSLN